MRGHDDEVDRVGPGVVRQRLGRRALEHRSGNFQAVGGGHRLGFGREERFHSLPRLALDRLRDFSGHARIPRRRQLYRGEMDHAARSTCQTASDRDRLRRER